MPNSNVKPRTLKLAKMALMVAIAVVCSFIHFPILPMATFLEFEVSDIPILIAGFVFGPVAGLVIGIVAIALHDMMMGPSSGPYGMIMHIIAIGVFVLVSSAIYQKFKTRKGGLFALIIGGLCMTAAMIPANLLVTPAFAGFPIEAIYRLILPENILSGLGVAPYEGVIPFPPILIPFNLLKMALNTAVVFLLYKRLSPFLHKW